MKGMALIILFGLLAQNAPSQTEHQNPQSNTISEKDLTDTLDYCHWFLDVQYAIDHPNSNYAKELFTQLNLGPADEAAFRTIMGDFNKRHDELMANHYAKIKIGDWTPETETQLIRDLIDGTKDAINAIRAHLSPGGARKVDNFVVRGATGTVFEHS